MTIHVRLIYRVLYIGLMDLGARYLTLIYSKKGGRGFCQRKLPAGPGI